MCGIRLKPTNNRKKFVVFARNSRYFMSGAFVSVLSIVGMCTFTTNICSYSKRVSSPLNLNKEFQRTKLGCKQKECVALPLKMFQSECKFSKRRESESEKERLEKYF